MLSLRKTFFQAKMKSPKFKIILIEIQDFDFELNDLRKLYFAYYLKNILGLLEKNLKSDEIVLVPIIFQFLDQLPKFSIEICQLNLKTPLGMKFSDLELIHDVLMSNHLEKKSIIIRQVINRLKTLYECCDSDILVICNTSSEYHFLRALDTSHKSVLCCIQSCFSSFEKRGDYLEFIIDSVYQKLIQKVVGSSNETTRKLAESKVHILFSSVKKTKRLDLDQQCETNDTGIHLQYSIARIEGIKKYLESDLVFMESDKCVSKSDLDILFKQYPKSLNLYDMLENFEERLSKSVYEPNSLLTYASSLSKLISSLYYHIRIKGEHVDTQKARWFLFSKSLKTLSIILKLFHVEPVQEI